MWEAGQGRATLESGPADTSPPPPDPFLGTVLDGRYRIEAPLGRGGMGRVYRAEHLFLKRAVAVKVLHAQFAGQPEVEERFRREAEIGARLRSPAIVEVLDFGHTADGCCYLAMELLEGESLHAFLRREKRIVPECAAELLRQLLEGLAVAHAAGVVHRDVKPENVWLSLDALGRISLKLLDFGIARIADPAAGGSPTQIGTVIGTPQYMSPEQALGLVIDHRADLYSVGLLAFVMLAGRHPYAATDAQSLLAAQVTAPVPDLGVAAPELRSYPHLVEFVRRATAKDREGRAQSAKELLALVDQTVDPEAQTQLVRRLAFLGQNSRTRYGRQAIDKLRHLIARGGAVKFAAAACVLLLVAGALATRRAPLPATGPVVTPASAPVAAPRPAPVVPPPDPNASKIDDLIVRGRTLHATKNVGEGLAAYRAAAALDPKLRNRADVIADLIDDLGGPESKEAGDLLVGLGHRASVPLLAAASDAKSFRRRWAAIDLLKRLGLEKRVDYVGAYIADLSVPDCKVQQRAARRLGQLKDPRGLEPLKKVAERGGYLFEPCDVAAARAALKAFSKPGGGLR